MLLALRGGGWGSNFQKNSVTYHLKLNAPQAGRQTDIQTRTHARSRRHSRRQTRNVCIIALTDAGGRAHAHTPKSTHTHTVTELVNKQNKTDHHVLLIYSRRQISEPWHTVHLFYDWTIILHSKWLPGCCISVIWVAVHIILCI